MAGDKGKSLAKSVVFINWVILGGLTLLSLTVFAFAFGKLDATNTFLEAFTRGYSNKRISELKEGLQETTDILTCFSITIAVSILVQVLLNTLLTVAVKKSDQLKLRIWLVLTGIRMCIIMYYVIRKLNSQTDKDNATAYTHLAELTWAVVCFLVVNHFHTGLSISAGDTDSKSQEKNPGKVTVMNA